MHHVTLYRTDLLAARDGCCRRGRLGRGAVHFAGTCRVPFVISGYYVKASLLAAVYLMLGGSNRGYYRVHVSARTALTSTAILILTLGANTARERALRPTVRRSDSDRRFGFPSLSLSLSPSLPPCSVFFFLSVIQHLSRRVLVTMIFLSRSLYSPLPFLSFLLVSFSLDSSRLRYDFCNT